MSSNTIGILAYAGFFASALSLGGASSSAQANEVANETLVASQQPVMQVTTDVRPGMVCDLKVILTDTNEMTGAAYDCTGVRMQTPMRVFTLDELRKGVILYHEDSHNLDVVSLAAPNLDAIHGGPVNIHYLFNGITSEYRDFAISVEPQGAHWLVFTSDHAGLHAFNRMFLAKKSVLGSVVGIKEIQVSWVAAQR